MDQSLTGSQPQIREPWSAIESTLNQLAEQQPTATTADEFFGDLSEQLRRILRAESVAIWTRHLDGHVELMCEADRATSSYQGRSYAERAADVESTLLASAVRRVADDGPSERWLLPVNHQSTHAGCPRIFELRFSPRLAEADQQYVEEVTRVFAATAVDFADQVELHDLRRREQADAQVAPFLLRIHRQPNALATAFYAVNEGRCLLGGDRISILAIRGAKTRLLTASGVDVVDRRSQFCRTLEPLAAAVCVTGQPLTYPTRDAVLPPQLQTALDQFLLHTPAQRLSLLLLPAPHSTPPNEQPLSVHVEPQDVVGVLAIEDFANTDKDDTNLAVRAEIAAHLGTALGHRLMEERPPLSLLFRSSRPGQRASRQRRWLMAALTLAGLLTALFGIRNDLRVSARGTLEPVNRQEVFATSDGIVRRIHVAHGDQVTAGQLVVELEDSDLEFKLSQVLGELRTAQQQLQSVRAKRLSRTVSNAALDDDLQLAAEQQRLTQRIAAFEEQRQLLRHQIDELSVRSPIDGVVLTWDLTKRLRNRPVQRGNLLMSIADPTGPWNIEVWVSDRDLAHVIGSDQGDVQFLLATDSTKTHAAHLIEVSQISEAREDSQVRVTARVEDGQDIRERAGASVVAKIDCGKRSLSYLWFHDLFERARTWWF